MRNARSSREFLKNLNARSRDGTVMFARVPDSVVVKYCGDRPSCDAKPITQLRKALFFSRAALRKELESLGQERKAVIRDHKEIRLRETGNP